MEWIHVLTIIGANFGGMVFLWQVLGKRIDDAKDESVRAHEGTSQRISELTERFDLHLHWHASDKE